MGSWEEEVSHSLKNLKMPGSWTWDLQHARHAFYYGVMAPSSIFICVTEVILPWKAVPTSYGCLLLDKGAAWDDKWSIFWACDTAPQCFRLLERHPNVQAIFCLPPGKMTPAALHGAKHALQDKPVKGSSRKHSGHKLLITMWTQTEVKWKRLKRLTLWKGKFSWCPIFWST